MSKLYWLGCTTAGILAMWPVAEVLQPPALLAAAMGGVGAMAGMIVAAVLIDRRERMRR